MIAELDVALGMKKSHNIPTNNSQIKVDKFQEITLSISNFLFCQI